MRFAFKRACSCQQCHASPLYILALRLPGCTDRFTTEVCSIQWGKWRAATQIFGIFVVAQTDASILEQRRRRVSGNTHILNTFHYYPHNILCYREVIKKKVPIWRKTPFSLDSSWSKKKLITSFISVAANMWPLQLGKGLLRVVVHKSSLIHYAKERSATYSA
jgi:hypothetical protein